MSTCMCTHHLILGTQGGEKKSSVPGTGVTNGCELSCGCWELNPGLSKSSRHSLTYASSFQSSAMQFKQTQLALFRNCALKMEEATVNLDSISDCYDLWINHL